MICQLDIVNAILDNLERSGLKELNSRQLNAAIRAADKIMTDLHQPHAEAMVGMGLQKWLRSDETGKSSLYMAHILAPLARLGVVQNPRKSYDEMNPHPYDPSDFSRCVKLLDAVPELRAHLKVLGEDHGPVWSRLIAHWDEMEALYREEFPSGKAPKLYARMTAIRDEAAGEGKIV